MLSTIRSTGKLEDETLAELKSAVQEVKRNYTAGAGEHSGSTRAGTEEHQPVSAGEVDQEEIAPR